MSLVDYRGLAVLSSAAGAGGQAISDNFLKIADRFAFLATSDPTAMDDSSEGFNIGSRWYNTAGNIEWVCTDASTGAAVWRSAANNPFDQDLDTTGSPTFAGLDVDGPLDFASLVDPAGGRSALELGTAATYDVGSGSQQVIASDGSGNVGIGTASPTERLAVAGSTGAGVRVEGGSGSAAVRLITGTDQQGTFQFFENANLDGAFLYRHNSSNRMEFVTYASGSDIYFAPHRNCVFSAGNVGVGTSSPSEKLVVAGAAGVAVRVEAGTGNAGVRLIAGTDQQSTFQFLEGSNLDGAFLYRHNSANRMEFVTYASGSDIYFAPDRNCVFSSGNVGIGATAPSAKLDVDSDKIRLRTARTPASSVATGDAGDICWDGDYIYIWTAANTVKRAALLTW